MAWRRTSARRLAELVGDLASDRPPRYAALAGAGAAAGRRRPGAAGHPAAGRARPRHRAGAEPGHGHRRLRPAARGRLGHRPPGRGHLRRRCPAGPHRGAWVPGPVDDGAIDLAHAAPVGARRRCRPRSPPRSPSCRATCPQHGYHPAGLPELRARIAERYTARGLPTTPEQVLVTAGALHGVATAFQTLLRPRAAAAGRAADLSERARRRPGARRRACCRPRSTPTTRTRWLDGHRTGAAPAPGRRPPT